MKIAVLAWGSLFWDQGELQVQEPWYEDVPSLPIEFARVSNRGRLTLVIHRGSKKVPVLWALSAFDDVNVAAKNLQKREHITLPDRIGQWISGNGDAVDRVPEGTDFYLRDIAKWGMVKKLDAVIWTGLASNFLMKTGRSFSQIAAIDYIKTLEGKMREEALDYINNAPLQIETELRPYLSVL